jgi:hypothetical protein
LFKEDCPDTDAALKTGINAILNTDIPIVGCLTVDADGQHLPEDILKTAEVFERNSSALVLGCRDFSTGNVPAKSRFGNLLTRAVYKLSTGKTITDTQTGLRAIPVDLSLCRMAKSYQPPPQEYHKAQILEPQ